MVPKTRSKTHSPNAPTTPEQKEKVVKVPTTTKRTIQKKTTKASTAPKNSKKKLNPKPETDVDIKTESDQTSGSQSASTTEAQPEVEPEVKPESIKRPAKKRGRKPKVKSTAESEQPSHSGATPASDSQPSTQPESSAAPAESSQPSDSQTIAQGMSVINIDSDSEEKPKAKRVARSKTTKETKPRKEPTTRVVKPNVNKKEKRRKVQASEIPGFSTLSKDMASRVVRVLLQRIFVLSRSQDDESRETFEIIGSTGTSYTVKISDKLSCSCVDYRFKKLHCKHILTVLLKVYHLHFSNPLFKSIKTTYNNRKAAISNSAMVDPSVLISNEVREKIENVLGNKPSTGTMEKAEQRPLDTSDCPVCFETFEPENINFIAFCYTCGNNIHKECLEQWIRSKGGLDRATCVYCRSPWVEIDETPTIKKWNQVDAGHRDGKFVNFSKEFGMKRTRDQSTYGDNYLNFIE